MPTEVIARFIAQSEYADIPSEVTEVAKKCILDGLGVGILGSQTNTGRTILQYVKMVGGEAQSGCFAADFKTSAPLAALANGAMIHALDYDDDSRSWHAHPSAVLTPAALASGEAIKVSGKKLLQAYIIGWETGARVSLGAHNKIIDRGWHPQGVIGTIGAVAAAAKVLGLDAMQTRRALGIAASSAAGLSLNLGTDTKPFHAGHAAMSGVTAATLARLGWTANESILESDRGFCELFGGEKCDSDVMTRDIGRSYDLAGEGAIIKRYPSCAGTHCAIDAMLEIVKRHDINPADVAAIEFEAAPYVPQYLRFHNPKTGLEGKFSTEFCLAAALLNKEVNLGLFSDDYVSSPSVQQLVNKVHYSRYPGSPEGGEGVHGPQRVTVRLNDGRSYLHEAGFIRGAPGSAISSGHAMDWNEVVSKFENSAKSVLSPKAISLIVGIVHDLPGISDISELALLVTRSH